LAPLLSQRLRWELLCESGGRAMNEFKAARHDERTLAGLIIEIRDEIQQFLQTRVDMLRSEFRETVKTFKTVAPLALLATVLLASAYLLFTLALVGLIAVAFWNNPYHWFFAFLIVGAVWLSFGGLAAYFAWNRLRAHGMFPRRTVEVLKADKIWIQKGVRTQL
jgi:Putative Actinobacterial Holin-X, holin superfamily III